MTLDGLDGLTQPELHRAAASLEPVPVARVIHQNVAHDLAGQPEKLGSVLAGGLLLVHLAHLNFVDQSCAVQRRSMRSKDWDILRHT